jgi:uncharacterized membrane protein (TIGR01666 family)
VDYLKQYRNFVSSHYLSDGVRITAAILTPVLLFGYFNLLPVGLAVALGALSVSITDAPGPIHHRRNGLMVCSLLVFAMALLAGYAEPYPWLFALLLPVMCFVFSIIGVYGARATAVGLASLIIFVIQTQQRVTGMEVVYNALFILAGGAWYLVLSSLLYSLRPYRIIQQALGDYVMSVAAYLRAKAVFYDKGFSYEKDYADILSVQVKVQAQQALVAELLFKTRSVVKESTHTGRVLMMVFLDVTDLFEIVMTSHQDYEKLHGYFGESGILEEYRQLINTLAEELDQVGIALKSGRRSGHDETVDEEISTEREHLKALRAEKLDPANLEGFISLRHILDSIDELSTRIRSLHQYTGYDKKLRKKKIDRPDPETFITHQPLDAQLVFDNLSFRSNIFRHSLRISAAALFAYIISWFLPLGHSYWILLTVIVILKPGYGLTRTRNFERLVGTIIGALLGALLLYLVRDRTVIIVFLGVSMIGAYSFMRKTYFISVILMTLYILLMFHLLEPQDFKTILTDRIIDTTIGSVIAFGFGYLFAPVWEHEQVHVFMSVALADIANYYRVTAELFTGKTGEARETVAFRRNSWVSMANLSDAFTRMLSEPKSKQRNIEYVHQFVVAAHMLNSHIATLSYYADPVQPEYTSADYQPLINASVQLLQQAQQLVNSTETKMNSAKPDINQIRLLDQRVNSLVRKRQEELRLGQMETKTRQTLSDFKSITDQFYFIYKIAGDLEKVCVKLSA